jgi:hypothetical protein
MVSACGSPCSASHALQVALFAGPRVRPLLAIEVRTCLSAYFTHNFPVAMETFSIDSDDVDADAVPYLPHCDFLTFFSVAQALKTKFLEFFLRFSDDDIRSGGNAAV